MAMMMFIKKSLCLQHGIYGLVGYDVRLTRGRSPVQFRVDVVYVVPVAQWIRHLTTNQGIVGSNPTRDVFC